MSDSILFPEYSLPIPLVEDLRRQNPWWEGKALPPLPPTRRHLVSQMRRRIDRRLAPILVVRGPRQIGKTTAQLQTLSDFLQEGVPVQNIFRVQCDDLPELRNVAEPILRLADWYERSVLKRSLNAVAQSGQRTYIFLDEVQNLKDWAPQLKSLVDSSSTTVVVTGSSALRIELGRDSLAGRISTLEAGVLTLTEIAAFHNIDLGEPFLADNGLEPLGTPQFWRDLAAYGESKNAPRDEAFRWFSERGGYPLVHQRSDVSWNVLADQLNETVIRRVIQHDLRVGERGRKRDAPLLEEVFRLCCRYVGQSPAPVLLAREAQRALNANVGPQRITQYLRFLGDTLLLRLIDPLEIRLKRKSRQCEDLPCRPWPSGQLAARGGAACPRRAGATTSIEHSRRSPCRERGGRDAGDDLLTRHWSSSRAVGRTRDRLRVNDRHEANPAGNQVSATGRSVTRYRGLTTFLEKSVNSAVRPAGYAGAR